MNRAEQIHSASWSAESLGEAIRELASRGGMYSGGEHLNGGARLHQIRDDGAALGEWIELAADRLGIEAEPVRVPHSELENFLRRAAPAVVRLPGTPAARFLAMLYSKKKKAGLLAPDGNIHWVRTQDLRDVLCESIEAPIAAEMGLLLEEAGIARHRKSSIGKALIGDRLRLARIDGCWLLRLPPGAAFWRQARGIRIPQRVAALVGAQITQHLLLLGAWWLVGRGALLGYFEKPWLIAWALLLITMIPFRLVATWLQGVISFALGGLIKQRLLSGALKLDLEDLRYKGAGQQLALVIESAAVEALSLSGGFMALLAVIELATALLVINLSAGGLLKTALFLGWAMIAALMAWRYWSQLKQWTESRLRMTNELVEKMIGHRTRLAQEARELWHESEDSALAQYLDKSRMMDRSTIFLTGLIPRGWLLLGLSTVAWRFAAQYDSIGSVAVGLAGILLGYQALGRFAGSLAQLAGAIIVWRQVAPLFAAAGRADVKGSAPAAVRNEPAGERISGGAAKLVQAQDLVFRYRDREEAVLRGCSLEIHVGDRLMLEGKSGCGKSTLASIMAGLRFPDSGLLLMRGLDYQTVGARGWRRLTAEAPQFHENHILTGSLAFNLLMGRRWPAEQSDLAQAEAICRELGLGDLIDRMPAGLLQIVGETGWQLSHGERSRLFLARALLQGADLVILDESFASLDPESLGLALPCVLNRAPTLLVIAHN